MDEFNQISTKTAQDRFYGCVALSVIVFAIVALIIGYWATH